jgi:hypothetical protein
MGSAAEEELRPRFVAVLGQYDRQQHSHFQDDHYEVHDDALDRGSFPTDIRHVVAAWSRSRP